MKEKIIIEKFKKTKYWHYLISHIEDFEKELNSFKSEFNNFLEDNTDEMSVVLKCHLIIEYYIDKYITVAFPTISNIEKMKLSFATKIEMINNPSLPFRMFYDSLKEINKLRNKFAHNLLYKIAVTDISQIAYIMNAWNDAGGYKRTEGLELITQYTMKLSALIFSITNTIKKETANLGVAGYIKWMKEINT